MEKQKVNFKKQFFIVIDGPSCGGKSAVAKVMLERINGLYFASGDRIKWLISNYDAQTHRGVVHEMVLATISIALKSGLSVIKEGALFESERLSQIAQEHKVPLIVINISAPKNVLDKRFEERIEAKKNGAKISNTSHERFDGLYEMYLKNKMETPMEFDSSAQTPEEIADAILAYLEKI